MLHFPITQQPKNYEKIHHQIFIFAIYIFPTSPPKKYQILQYPDNQQTISLFPCNIQTMQTLSTEICYKYASIDNNTTTKDRQNNQTDNNNFFGSVFFHAFFNHRFILARISQEPKYEIQNHQPNGAR
jgi:hypothetical protein